MTNPVVSIIIPVFNRPELVREAITSALAESSTVPLEVIVVDDASTDETPQAVASFGDRVRTLRLPQNAGQSAARNDGLEAARATFVKFLDSDDVLESGHLEHEVRRADAEGADIVVAGWGTLFPDGARREFQAPTFANTADDVLTGKAVPTTAALYLRARCARWDPALRKLDDWDFFCQNALNANKVSTEPGVSYWMREHRGQRATDVSMLVNAREHHAILHKIEERLAAQTRLTETRRRRLAQYYYKELRVLSLHDREAFELAVRHIHELDPNFRPVDEERQIWMRAAARILGVRRAVLFHSAIKKLVRGLRAD